MSGIKRLIQLDNKGKKVPTNAEIKACSQTAAQTASAKRPPSAKKK